MSVAAITPSDPASRSTLKAQSNTALGNMAQGASPEDIMGIFTQFALSHFGAYNEKGIYEKFGDDIQIRKAGIWSHISRNSATISWSTNLPGKSLLQYGETSNFESSTQLSKRFFYNHVVHLRDLKEETTYHYRMVVQDEKGLAIASEHKTFTTKQTFGAIEISPSDFFPYSLDIPNSTYILTGDIDADGTALDIQANNITVDLNGYTITYAKSHHETIDPSSLDSAHSGIRGRHFTLSQGLRIFNGRIEEGDGNNKSKDRAGGLNPIYLSDVSDVEIAGISISYHGAQLFGMYLTNPDGEYKLHHNVFFDKGWEITNRHGASGGRSIYLKDSVANSAKDNNYKIYFNLVKRTRQNGLSQAQKIFENEVYVDSWSTNAFAIQPHSNVSTKDEEIYNNKIFLTGYHAIALGWSHYNLHVGNNVVHMEGIKTNKRRWHESFGDQDSLNGFRVTNYGKGSQVRDSLQYYNNLIIGRARKGGQMRGTEFFTDKTITNLEMWDSVVDVTSVDSITERVAAIVTQGVSASKLEHKPHNYKSLHLLSNVANVRFGDSYGRGNNHDFYDCTFEKVDSYVNYHTFVFDGAYTSYEHDVINPKFIGGARADDVYWKKTATTSSYSIGWTLRINGEPGAKLSITDKGGATVYSGSLDNKGLRIVNLKQMDIRPSEWIDGGPITEVVDKLSHQKVFKTPHVVTVDWQNKSVFMDAQRSLYF